MSHTHDGLSAHTHDFNAADHGHSHEILDGPGSYTDREPPIIEGRDWTERAFTVGIGGYMLLACMSKRTSPDQVSRSSGSTRTN